LAILGVPLAVPLAVVTFFGAYIPIIGAFISGALAVLVTLVTNSPRDALIALLIVVFVQQLEGNVLSPYLQGKNLNLHAAVVLLSVTAGGTLFGITGAFLAVPVAATTAEILRYVNERIDAAVSESAPPEDSESAERLEERADD
jgi:predicted PurR-regulated permease PerM